MRVLWVDSSPRYREIRELAILGHPCHHLLEEDEYVWTKQLSDGSIVLKVESEDQVTLYQTTLFPKEKP